VRSSVKLAIGESSFQNAADALQALRTEADALNSFSKRLFDAYAKEVARVDTDKDGILTDGNCL
jgi:hypothetical protein